MSGTLTPPPVFLLPSRLTLAPVANTQSGGRSPFDGSEQTLELPGQRWTASLGWDGLTEDEWRPLLAFLASLGGRAGRFFWGPPVPRRGDAGSTDGRTPRVLDANQLGRSLTTTGWGASGFAARAGDMIGFTAANGRRALHMVTADVPSSTPTATNFCLHSTAPNNAAFGIGGNTVDLGAVADPQGGTTARRLRSGPAGPGNVFITQANFVVAPASRVTLSLHARRHAGTLAAASGLTVDERNAAGVLLARTGTLSLTGLGTTWQRLSRQFVTRPDTHRMSVFWADNWSVGGELDVWGFQAEQRPVVDLPVGFGPNTLNIGTVSDPIGGTSAGRLVSGPSGPGGVFLVNGSLPVRAGDAYTLSVWLRAHSGSVTMGSMFVIDELDASRRQLRRAAGSLNLAGLGATWQRFERSYVAGPQTAFINLSPAADWNVGTAIDVFRPTLDPADTLTPLIATGGTALTRTQSVALPLAPPIRGAPAAGADIALASPSSVWRLSQDRSPMEIARGLVAGGTIEIEEALI